MRVALIIPALDEAEVIGGLVRRVPRGSVAEVIVVDNGSTDATASEAAGAGARVVSEPRRGYGSACWAGVAALKDTTEVAVFLDGDGSQHPEEIPLVLAPLEAGRADLVLGARQFAGHHPLARGPGDAAGGGLRGLALSRAPERPRTHCARSASTSCGASACAIAASAGPWRWSSRPPPCARESSRCR